MTEKSVKMVEIENKIVFIVARTSRKGDIKKEFESTFDSKIASINIQIRKNQKIAFIKMKEPNAAVNIVTKLGIM